MPLKCVESTYRNHLDMSSGERETHTADATGKNANIRESTAPPQLPRHRVPCFPAFVACAGKSAPSARARATRDVIQSHPTVRVAKPPTGSTNHKTNTTSFKHIGTCQLSHHLSAAKQTKILLLCVFRAAEGSLLDQARSRFMFIVCAVYTLQTVM